MDSWDVCQSIIEYSKLCYDRNLVSVAGGNISMRNANSIFITATNAPLRQLAFQDIVELDMAGTIIGDNQTKKPSKEAGMLCLFTMLVPIQNVFCIFTQPMRSFHQ